VNAKGSGKQKGTMESDKRQGRISTVQLQCRWRERDYELETDDLEIWNLCECKLLVNYSFCSLIQARESYRSQMGTANE